MHVYISFCTISPLVVKSETIEREVVHVTCVGQFGLVLVCLVIVPLFCHENK